MRTPPLHQRLLSRAVVLETTGQAKSVEHGLVQARNELELEHNKQLHEAHAIALEVWHDAQSEARQAVSRRTLDAVGEQLRHEEGSGR